MKTQHGMKSLVVLTLVLPFFVIELGCGGGGGNGEAPGPYECSDQPLCGADRYSGDRPDDAIHVNACCPIDDPDGSLEKPYATINAALDAAQPGDTVAVAAGTYDPVEISKRVSLLGAGADRCALVPSSGDAAAMEITGVQQVAVSGLMLSGSVDALASPCSPPACMDRQALTIPAGVGLVVSGADDVSISNVVVREFEHVGDWTGIGILVTESTGVSLQDIVVSANAKAGIVYSGSTGEITGAWLHHNGSGAAAAAIAIVDDSAVMVGSAAIPLESAGSFAAGGCLVEDNDAIGVFVRESSISFYGSKVRGNLHGGAAFDTAAPDNAASVIRNNFFEDNASFGISLVNHTADVISNRFAGTTDCDGDCVGHCVNVAGDDPTDWPQIAIEDNLISDCAGAGIILDGQVIATVDGNFIDNALRWGGIWVQGGVDVVSLTSNTIVAAALVGIAVTTDSRAQIINNTVNDTWEESFYHYATDSHIDMADGIVVSQVTYTAGVLLEANTISNSGRAGIIIDAASTEQVVFASEPELRNKVSGSGEAEIVLQNGAEPIAEAQDLVENVVGLSDLTDIVTDQVFSIVQSMTTAVLSSPCVPPACMD